MKKITGFVLRHKFYALIVLLIIGTGGYFGYQRWFAKNTTVRYVTAAVERGTLISSISGTGQVSVSNQVNISAKVSGDVVYVGTQLGQEVKAGAVLLSLNASDALKSVRDAQTNLDTARLSLEKLTAPADALSVLQAENSLASAQESKQKAEDNLNKSYEDMYNTIASVFLNLPAIVTDLNDVLYSNQIGASETYIGGTYQNFSVLLGYTDQSFKDEIQILQIKAENDYKIARAKYDTNFEHYKTVTRSDRAATEDLLAETMETSKLIAQAVKDEINYLDVWSDYRSQGNQTVFTKVQTYRSDLSADSSQINSHITSLLSMQRTVQDYREAIVSAGRTIAEKTESLANLKAGADALDLRSQQIAVQQKEDALADAKAKLADYSVRAPFDGVIAAFSVKKGDSVSSGSTLGTLITKQKIATIALNEVDVAKVKVGQKVTLTFDAVDDLNISGEVAEVDALGTVSQGVVSYNVKIAFDVQDDRIKPGMTVTANIILESKPDVLLVSSGAVKSQGNLNYVEELDSSGAVVRKTVTVGGSNDTQTEITGGLTEEEEVIAQKITVTADSTGQSSVSGNSNNSRAMQGMFIGGQR